MANVSPNHISNKKLMKLRFPKVLWSHRDLWWRLTERDVLGRYRGSLLGVAWSFLNPLAMLAVYTFVFSQIFKARWGNLDNEGPLGFAINLFAGLIVFNMIAECLTKAPGLIVANPNYVKKVIFPLEVLPCVAVSSALFHAELGCAGSVPVNRPTWAALEQPLASLCLVASDPRLPCCDLDPGQPRSIFAGYRPIHRCFDQHHDVHEPNLLSSISTASEITATHCDQPYHAGDRTD